MKSNIINVGCDSTELDLFESQYIIPNGMAYNSYLILDEKIALLDTVDTIVTKDWLLNIKTALDGRKIDYLIITHMEPDHSANIRTLIDEFPEVKLVGNPGTFNFLKQLFDCDFSDRQIVVKDKDSLSLGKHQLTFYTAPMVHWPEVMVAYEKTEKVLFSADAFGKFGTKDADEEWACEARRYYFNIVGKYGQQVQNLFQKLAPLEIKKICSLHGPVLTENLEYYLSLYQTWSTYQPEEDGVFIIYTSVYGSTKKAAEILANKLKAAGVKVAIEDLARSDFAENIEDAFKYSKLVVATTTYNNKIFPIMDHFINQLADHNYQKRKIGIIENGTWSPQVTKILQEKFKTMKDITLCENIVTVKSSVKAKNLEELEALAQELI